MTTFKKSAIKILERDGKPLHYTEITRLALESGILGTEGETPAATMNALISSDIKRKGKKSDFIRKGRGIYYLNPNRKIVKEETKKIIEEEMEEQRMIIEGCYTGKGGEHLVCSELLFRGFNASIMGVDQGIDIAVIKGEKFFGIQVKTANKNERNTYPFFIRRISFERHYSGNVFYIFVLKFENKKDFIIMSASDIKREIKSHNIYEVNRRDGYAVSISKGNNRYTLGNQNNDLSHYLNNWDLIR